MVKDWFVDIKTLLNGEEEIDITWEDPQHRFKTDETGFLLCPKSGRVACTKGISNVYQFITCGKSQLTVMACIYTSMTLSRPMIVFAGQQFNFNPLDGSPEASFLWTL